MVIYLSWKDHVNYFINSTFCGRLKVTVVVSLVIIYYLRNRDGLTG